MPPLDYFTWNSCWTCTWTGADPGVLVHFCRVSEAKIIAARCAMHRPAPKIRIPEPGTPVDREEAPDPQSFSSYPGSCPTAPASSRKGVCTPVLTSNGLGAHTLQILVAAPWPRVFTLAWIWGLNQIGVGSGLFWIFGKEAQSPKDPGNRLEVGVLALGLEEVWNLGLSSFSPDPILWESKTQSVIIDGSISNTGQWKYKEKNMWGEKWKQV